MENNYDENSTKSLKSSSTSDVKLNGSLEGEKRSTKSNFQFKLGRKLSSSMGDYEKEKRKKAKNNEKKPKQRVQNSNNNSNSNNNNNNIINNHNGNMNGLKLNIDETQKIPEEWKNEEGEEDFKKVLVFSMGGCTHCIKAKKGLQQSNIQFEDINIDLFPDIREELFALTNSCTLPQIFFGRRYIGGNAELTEMLTAEEKQPSSVFELVEQMKETKIERNDPLWRIYVTYLQLKQMMEIDVEKDMNAVQAAQKCTPDQYKDLLINMRDKVKGVPIHNHRHLWKSYRKCFQGRQAVHWMIKYLKISKEEAIEVGNEMMRKHLFHNVTNNDPEHYPFADDVTLYRFIEDEELSALNFHFVSMCEPRNAAEIAMHLRKTLLAIFDAFLSEDGKTVNYAGIASSYQFKNFENTTTLLQRLNLKTMNDDEKIAFFINVYNALIIHGFIRKGYPSNFFKRYSFFTSTSYIIGGVPFSLDGLLFNIIITDIIPS